MDHCSEKSPTHDTKEVVDSLEPGIDRETPASEADQSDNEMESKPSEIAVNIFVLGPMNFLETKPDFKSFLAPLSTKFLRMSDIISIDAENFDPNAFQRGESFLATSENTRYTSVKENHMDQSQSSRDICISEGNRIMSDGRRWFLTQVFYKYEAEALNCVLSYNSNMKPVHFFHEGSQSNLFVLVGLAQTMNVAPYLLGASDDIVSKAPKHDESSELFSPCVIHPPFPVIVDTINGPVPFSSQELLFTNGLKDYVNLKLNSGRCTRRTVCKHFDPFQKIQCRYGTNCHFIHISGGSMDRILQPATLYPPLRLPKLEDDLQISTCENNRRQDTLLLRYLPEDLTETEVEYMFQECEGFCSSYFQRNEFYSTAIIRFTNCETATRALLQASESELNISFYGVVEDLKALLITDARECNYLATAIERLDGDKIKAKESIADSDHPPTVGERGKFRYDRELRNRKNDYEGGDLRRADEAKRGRREEHNVRVHEAYDGHTRPKTSHIPAGYLFPSLPPNWSYQLNTKGSQFYFYAVGREDETTWFHPLTKEMYFPS